MQKRHATPKRKPNASRRKATKEDAPGSEVAGKKEEILKRILSLIPEDWDVKKEGSKIRAFHLLDSYNMSLLCAGWALLEFPGNQAKIRLLPEKGEYGFKNPPGRNDPIADSLPPGPLKDAAAKILGAWRLGRRAEGIERVERHRISNKDRRGVARLYIRTYECAGGNPVTAVEVNPYHDYSHEVEAAGRKIENLYPLSSIPYSIYRSFPETVRMISEPAPAADPNQETGEAAVYLLRYILNRVRHYEPGVAADGDPEVLHQYRVSIRRMRSLVALLKTAFPPKRRKTLGTELKAAMQVTNRLRDLDVQIAEMLETRSSLPDTLQPGIDRLIRCMRMERGKELKSVRKAMAAVPFEDRFSDTIAAIARRPAPGSGTIAHTLAAAISKRFRSITEEVGGLKKQSTPEQLHRLRVSCKKMRYLIDFFPKLLDGDIASLSIKKLKALQDLLGRYNDLTVQEVFLLSHGTRHYGDRRALMAIGAVVMQSNRQRRRLAKRSVAAAQKLCSTEIQKLLEGLVQKEIR